MDRADTDEITRTTGTAYCLLEALKEEICSISNLYKTLKKTNGGEELLHHSAINVAAILRNDVLHVDSMDSMPEETRILLANLLRTEDKQARDDIYDKLLDSLRMTVILEKRSVALRAVLQEKEDSIMRKK